MIFRDVECPNPAYSRLVASGIAAKIEKGRQRVEDILNEDYILCEPTAKCLWKIAEEHVFDTALKSSERKEACKDVLYMRAELEEIAKQDFIFYGTVKHLAAQHPVFLACLLLGKDVLDYANYGFPTRRSFSEAVTSYFFGEHRLGFERDYTWRQGKHKNTISQNIHGDLHVSQVNVSGADLTRETLFETEHVFDTILRDPKSTYLHAYQDWSYFLMITLKYAQAIGMGNMPEIVHWRETLEQAGGGVGTNTAEAMFGGSGPDFYLHDFEDGDIYREGQQPEKFRLAIPTPHDHKFQIPTMIDNKLVYFIESEKGTEHFPYFPQHFKEKKFTRQVEYYPEDLPHVLTATYKYFARDRTRLPRIMDMFLAEQNQP